MPRPRGRAGLHMQIHEFKSGDTFTLGPGLRVTILEVTPGGARLQIDAPEEVLISIGDPPDKTPLTSGKKPLGQES